MRRDEYINEINEIFKNEYKLKEFLKIAAYTQKYNLYNQIEIYNQANDIKAVASKSFWEDNLKMNIKDDELDNFVLITGNNKEQIKLYDINQIKKEGNLDIDDMVWTFNNNGESDYKALLDTTNSNNNEGLVSAYLDMLSEIDYIPDTLRKPIITTTKYLLDIRLDNNDSVNNTDLSGISSLDVNITSFVMKVSSNILKEIIEDFKEAKLNREKNKSLEDLIKELSEERKETVEKTVSFLFSKNLLSINGLSVIADDDQKNRIFNIVKNYKSNEIVSEDYENIDEKTIKNIENDEAISSTPEYDTEFYHLGNGEIIVDNNKIDEETNDYVKLAFINPDRTIELSDNIDKYYPEYKEDIFREVMLNALISDRRISLSQSQPVYNIPPFFDEPDLSKEDLDRIKNLKFTVDSYNQYIRNEKNNPRVLSTKDRLDDINNFIENGIDEMHQSTNKESITELKKALVEYYNSEFAERYNYEDFDDLYNDLDHIGLAYTETPDGNHNIQFELNINEGTWSQIVDGDYIVDSGSFAKENTISQMIEFVKSASFDELVYLDDEKLRAATGLVKDDEDNLITPYKKALLDNKNNTDYWVVEYNESSSSDLLTQFDYEGEIVTKDLLDEIKEVDNKINNHNKSTGENEYGSMTDDWLGYFKFYFDHIVDGVATEHIRIDIGDGNLANREQFNYLYDHINIDKSIANIKSDAQKQSETMSPQESLTYSNLYKGLESIFDKFDIGSSGIISKEDFIIRLFKSVYESSKYYSLDEKNLKFEIRDTINRDEIFSRRLINKGLPIAINRDEVNNAESEIIEYLVDNYNEIKSNQNLIDLINSKNKIEYNSRKVTVNEIEYEVADRLSFKDEKGNRSYYLLIDSDYNRIIIDGNLNRIDDKVNNPRSTLDLETVATIYDNKNYGDDYKVKYTNNLNEIRLAKGDQDLAYFSMKYDGLKYFDYQNFDWKEIDNYSVKLFKDEIKNIQAKHIESIKKCYERFSAGVYSIYKEDFPELDLINSIDLENGEYCLITQDRINKYHLFNQDLDYMGSLNNINDRTFDDIKESIEPILSLYKTKSKVHSAENYKITSENLGEGTELERLNNNINAIKTLNTVEREGRNATPGEKELLSKYVGWGGLSKVFNEDNKYYSELKSLLTDDEYKSARESSLTAFYTPTKVIEAIYSALGKMNVQGTREFNILEPSAGIGSFLGMKPDNLKNAKFTAVEKDSLSGRIAKALYPESNVVISGIEETNLDNNSFDVAIGNVPFGDFKVYDKENKNSNFLIHDYFFAKTLEKIKPGGIIAFITSSGTMDKQDTSVREYIAKKAEFIGAVRLPNNTFTKNAGTSVTSDIIFLKKRDNEIDLNEENRPDWLDVGLEQGQYVNKYFLENRSNILGDLKLISSQFGQTIACVDDGLNVDIREKIAEAVSTFSPTFISTQNHSNKVIKNVSDLNDIKPYTYTENNGEIYIKKSDGVEAVNFKTDKDKSKLFEIIKLRDNVQELLNAQLENKSDEEIKSLQLHLNTNYDNFVKSYGRLNQNNNVKLFEEDIASPVLKALEVYEKGEFKEKAKIFTERTIKGKTEITMADSIEDALLISLNTKAEVDIDYIAKLVDKDNDTVIDELYGKIFYDYKNGKYVTEDEYLSGDILKKIEALNDCDFKYKEKNLTALENILPPLLNPENITVKLGANWVPANYIQEFVSELYDNDFFPDISYNSETAEWTIANKSSYWYAIDPVGITDVYRGMNLIEDTLNGKIAVVRKTVLDAEGKEKRVIDEQKTIEIQDKQMDLKDKFNSWVWKDADRSKNLIDIYNRKFNSTVNREYNGNWLTFPEMNNNIKLMEHQKNAIARIIQGGNTLLAHVVGAGKTFEMIASAMESKRLGLCNKSLIVVPKHLTDQTGNEFLNLYPNANILVATAKDFSPSNRKEFCAKIATGNFDAIIMGQTQFEKIPMSKEFQESFMLKEIENIEKALDDLRGNTGSSRITIKNLEKARLFKIQNLEKLNDDTNKDEVVTFEELGIDRLYVDEAHHYKNLYIPTKLNNVQGIGQSNAKRASDLLMKCRYMDSITGNRGVVFATGTPISNNISEMYVMQTYLQNDALKEKDFDNFDGWVSNFAEAVSEMELTPEGTSFRMNTRLSKYINLPELQTIFREVADVKMQEDLELDIPDHNIHTVITKPSVEQRAYIESLAERAKNIRSGAVDRKEDNMLVVTNESRKAGLDMRLIDQNAPDDPNGKLSKCAENIYNIWERTSDIKGTQLMFSDIGVPGGKNFDIYQVIKDKLIKYGIPENEIAFIHDANTEKQKDDLFEKVRSGKIRVLMGSTSKMGTGTNVQDKLVAMHDLDCPWRPSDLEQRMGRIVRQGNQNDEVNIYRYVTEKTFDSYLWQMILRKQKFITQVMTNKIGSRDVFDDPLVMEATETIAQCAGDPIIKERFELETKVRNLAMLKRSHQQEQIKYNKIINITAPAFLEDSKRKIVKIQNDIETRNKNTLENEFSGMMINGILYNERKDASSAFQKTMSSIKLNNIKYRGFTIKLSKSPMATGTMFFDTATIEGNLNYSVSLGVDGSGNITRLDNVINKLEDNIEEINKGVDKMNKTLEQAREKQGQPFLREDEFRERQQRLNQIMIMLSDNSKVYNEDELTEVKESIERLFERELGIKPESEAFSNPARIVIDEKNNGENDIALYVNVDTLSLYKEVDNEIISYISCDSVDSLKKMLNETITKRYVDYHTRIAYDPLERDLDNDGVVARFDENDLDNKIQDQPDIQNKSFVAEMKSLDMQTKDNDNKENKSLNYEMTL